MCYLEFGIMLDPADATVFPSEFDDTEAMLGSVNPIIKQHNVRTILNFYTNVEINQKPGRIYRVRERERLKEIQAGFDIHSLGSFADFALIKLEPIDHSYDAGHRNSDRLDASHDRLQRLQPIPYVDYQGQWVDLSLYLAVNFTYKIDKIKDPGAFIGDRGYELQFRWWQSNGSSFRLFDLPHELRTMIYMHYIGGDAYPRVLQSSRGRFVSMQVSKQDIQCWHKDSLYGPDSRKPPRVSAEARFRGPNGALLAVCRDVGREASYVLWNNTRKCFIWSDMQLNRIFDYVFFPNSPAVNAYYALKHIHLAFSMTEFCKFFGATFFWGGLDEEIWENEDGRNAPEVLKILPQLNRLEVAFPSPATEARVSMSLFSTPWQCQLLIVDAILTYAFSHIKHIPNVQFCGAIKKTTKAKWAQILRDEKSGMSQQKQIDMEIERLEGLERSYMWIDG